MEKHSALGLSRNTTSTSGYASASVCSVNSASACVNRDLRWLRPIPNFRKPIKKTPRLDAGCQRGSLGNRRSALSTAWLALPHVDPARNQGPRPTPCPDPQVCGVFRGRALAGWAVCVQSGNGKFNGPSFFQFLQQLRPASCGTGRRVVVITDNAPYHHSRLHKPWREKHADRFVLDFLPPYSPELNPIERVWKLTRRRCLHNRYFENLKDIVSAVETEFAYWTRRNDVLRRLCPIT